MSGHADDLVGAGGIEAVDEGDADMDLSSLAVWISCGDAFAKSLEAAHLRLDPASGVVSGPAFSECPTVVPGGTKGFVSGNRRRAVLFQRTSIFVDRDDRSSLPVNDSGVALTCVTSLLPRTAAHGIVW